MNIDDHLNRVAQARSNLAEKPESQSAQVKHPIQPLYLDDRGTVRFKQNNIVRYLLDHGGFDLNKLAMMDFSQEDREQFAQLIGYSHSGYGGLGYVSNKVWTAAKFMYDGGLSEVAARNQFLEELFQTLQQGLREPIAELYGKHPDDLVEGED